MTEQELAVHEARTRMRNEYDRVYSKFWKCCTCGEYLSSARRFLGWPATQLLAYAKTTVCTAGHTGAYIQQYHTQKETQ